jgi:hypothetical protein
MGNMWEQTVVICLKVLLHFTWRDSNAAAEGFSGEVVFYSRFKPEITEIQIRRFKALFCNIPSDLIPSDLEPTTVLARREKYKTNKSETEYEHRERSRSRRRINWRRKRTMNNRRNLEEGSFVLLLVKLEINPRFPYETPIADFHS